MNTYLICQKCMYILFVLLLFSFFGCRKEDQALFKIEEPVIDTDGNMYSTIKINNQVWMAENLKVKSYNNGDLIETTDPPNLDLLNESSPKYMWAYNGDESNTNIYGLLYTWYTVTDSRKICPTGWHLSTDAEWTSLIEFLGGDSIAGGKLKESGILHYLSPNVGATNESGFSALPSGFRYSWGQFSAKGDGPVWWTSTEFNNEKAWFRSLSHSNTGIRRDNYPKNSGFSVRCIKD